MAPDAVDAEGRFLWQQRSCCLNGAWRCRTAPIVKWLKKEGDTVQEGEPLVEIETAKLETELEAIASGVVAHILVPEGPPSPSALHWP